jgi:phosphoribosylformylglycinamidine synthase PurS subunit
MHSLCSFGPDAVNSDMIRAQVIVRPRKSIFDPQGDAVCRAIQHLGVASLKEAHVGKCIELELEGEDVEKARAQLDSICKDLLSNPVIEDYVLTLSAQNGK